ncbi:MAG: glycosyltransferase [Polyangiales bacterium]
MDNDGVVERWRGEAPASVDLTLAEQDRWARTVAAELLERFPQPGELERLERSDPEAPVLLRLAMKLAQSRQRVLGLSGDFHISVVFAVYKEHNRLRTKDEHPHGEDFLVRKAEQIAWLFDALPGASWEMLVVDDGCPERSGAIAQEIIDARGLGDRVRVLFLQDAIDAGHPAAQGIASTADSQKGGSIEYGMSVAAEDDRPNHVVVFTDADLSTHLGQLGLLIDPILGRGYDAAIGSRREPMSIVIKSGARNARGKLFIYLWKRLIPELSPIIDTQCGFKAFRADVASRIVRDTVEKRFAFDIELLLRTVLERPDSIERVAIAWIDSEAASTTTELQPYLPMLKSLVRISEKYLPPNETARGFAALINSLDENSWARLSGDVPPEIAEREPIEFDGYDAVTPDDLRKAAQLAR